MPHTLRLSAPTPGRSNGDVALFCEVNAAGGHEWFPAVRTPAAAEAPLADAGVLVHVVASCCGRSVGHAALARPAEPDAYELAKVMVAADHKGRGIAAEMVAVLLGCAAGHQVYLTTLGDLAAMYTRRGFVEVDRYAGPPDPRHGPPPAGPAMRPHR